MSEGIFIMHKFYKKKEATDRVREILDLWETKSYSKTNDVPPNDPYINEFLQLMKGLGHPVQYKYQKKLKDVL